ncbi:hypothetical protein DdX_01661 [Ditylenchus destructor]|uniref:Uncharacterized protein n=1 Tax=Ditylenchus destructor TaxID=166010 RepID=A0AAD4NII2_9BILA|nr:hypothetical protein DdX_01661 [Ditylenchus destructor]
MCLPKLFRGSVRNSDVSNAQHKHSTPFLSDVNVNDTDNHHSSTSISARSSVKTCISRKYKNDPEIPRPHFMLDTKVSLARDQEAKKTNSMLQDMWTTAENDHLANDEQEVTTAPGNGNAE